MLSFTIWYSFIVNFLSFLFLHFLSVPTLNYRHLLLLLFHHLHLNFPLFFLIFLLLVTLITIISIQSEIGLSFIILAFFLLYPDWLRIVLTLHHFYFAMRRRQLNSRQLVQLVPGLIRVGIRHHVKVLGALQQIFNLHALGASTLTQDCHGAIFRVRSLTEIIIVTCSTLTPVRLFAVLSPP